MLSMAFKSNSLNKLWRRESDQQHNIFSAQIYDQNSYFRLDIYVLTLDFLHPRLLEYFRHPLHGLFIVLG